MRLGLGNTITATASSPCIVTKGDYLSDEFIEHLKSSGTHQELTMYDLPQQNRKAKRLN